MPVQWVNRPNLDFRGFSGQIVGGTVRPGDRVRVAARRADLDGGADRHRRRRPRRGGRRPVRHDLAGRRDRRQPRRRARRRRRPAEVADQFEAHIVWMHEHEMLPGRPYLVKIGTRTVGVDHRPAEVQGQRQHPRAHRRPRRCELNEIGVCNIHLDRPSRSIRTATNRDMGGFIVIDRLTNTTVGAGLLHFALRRAHNVHWQAIDVDQARPRPLKGHRPAVVWFTGLSGAGKSTIANLVEKQAARRRAPHVPARRRQRPPRPQQDLGFTEADRVENIRRVAEVGRLMVDAGLIVLVSFISPFRAERQLARELVGDGRVLRGLRRHAARGRRGPRPQGPLHEGPARRAPQLHRHRLAVRGARAPRGAHQDDRARRRGGADVIVEALTSRIT